MIQEAPSPHVPHYPTNKEIRHFIVAMDGQSQRTFFSMRDAIDKQTGTPQANQDWRNPDEWIPEILQDDQQILAQHLWSVSDGVLNPRYLLGVWLLSSSNKGYGLIDTDGSDTFFVTDRGEDFVSNPLGDTVQKIDYLEGLLNLLLIVSEHGPGKRSQFMPTYIEFLKEYSSYRSRNAFDTAWYGRIRNLTDRDLVSRAGVTYEISQSGLAYLETVGSLLEKIGRESATRQQTSIRQLIKDQKNEVRERLHETLSTMDPYKVEFLIKRLLEAMEYENVEVTSRGNDGGVDVVADIEVGITPVREVVQVKRRKNNIQRRTLDELRGSLHRFDATRGTIISTGGFSKGAQNAAFERGAPPITLIDGERLLDLLIEYEIGVRKRSVQLIEFEPADFIDEEEEL
jgi:restriction system protein